MQVWASVNEADIGSIFPGQAVSFTVDAWPGQTFRGTVAKIRLNATMTQNVVTYTVEIATDNSEGKLLPYLTANVRFEVTQREDVLTVPNSALRWTPLPEQVVPDRRESLPSGRGPADRQGMRARNPASQPGSMKRGILWVKDGGFARPVEVRAGLSDGSMTEIQSDNLKEGDEIIVGEMAPGQAADSEGTTNPFMPQFMRGRRGG
jgi:HlyD family secretion protein